MTMLPDSAPRELPGFRRKSRLFVIGATVLAGAAASVLFAGTAHAVAGLVIVTATSAETAWRASSPPTPSAPATPSSSAVAPTSPAAAIPCT